MQKRRKWYQLWIFIATIGYTASFWQLAALPQQSAEKCAKLAKAVVGLNYHRSADDAVNSGQVWRFATAEKLIATAADSFSRAPAEKSSEALWRITLEDERCVLKVSPPKSSPHWTSYRITDMTWAIVDTKKWQAPGKGEEKFVPDFEDHTGMKTRFCGIGIRCEKLWK